MTNELPEDALLRLIKREGGYVNDPDDPGGETNFGITHMTFKAWCAAQPASRKLPTLKDLTQEEAIEVYRWYLGKTVPDLFDWPEVLLDTLIDLWTMHKPKSVRSILTAALVNNSIAQPSVSWDQVLGIYKGWCEDEGDAVSMVNMIALERVRFSYWQCSARPSSRKYFYGWVHRYLSFTPSF